MKREMPLTPEQRRFAANHHDIVTKFLLQRSLPENEFYDVAIFGYLRAVRRFFNEEHLQHFEFTTIAWHCMEVDLINYLKKQKRKKYAAETVSIHTGLHDGDPPLEETLIAPDDLISQAGAVLLLHDLAKRASKQQMDIVRMRSDGYTLQDIACRQNTSTKRIRRLLKEVQDILMELCYW